MRNPPPPIVTREDPSARPSSGWLGVPIGLALLAGAWIALTSAGRSNPMVPTPAAVLEALDHLIRDPTFPGALTLTLLAAGSGFLIALFLGGVVSAVFASNLRMGTLVLLGVPAAALMPLPMVWFGIGTGTAIAGAALLAFGPIAVGFAADGAARRPAAVVGVAMALNGAVFAESIAGQGGLGAVAFRAAAAFLDMPAACAAVLVLAAIGVSAVLAVHVLFGLFVPNDREP
jgi:ABC-type nitrate/sulfonate/bicarbonate transport system permease component